MADFESELKTVPYTGSEIYAVLSNLENLELLKDRIPQDKVKDFTFDKDSCAISVDPVGKIRFVVVEREPNSTIKLQAEQLPFGMSLSILLGPSTVDTETTIKLVVEANLNPFLKPMVSKPLQQGLDKIAETLAGLPYEKILNKGTIE